MKNGGQRADVQLGLPAQEASLFIIRPASVWLAIWGQKGFQGNKSIIPADVFPEWKRPKVAAASNLAEAADRVMSGEVNGFRTTFDKMPAEPTWIPRYVDPQNTAYLISFHPPEVVKAGHFFIINGGEASFLTEWEVVAPS